MDGKDDMPAIELAARNQVERRGKHSYPCGDGRGMQEELAGVELCDGRVAAQGPQYIMCQLENEWHAESRRVAGLRRQWLACQQRKDQHRNRYDKSRDGAGDADIEEISPVANRRPDADKRAHGPDQAWERNKVGPGGIDFAPHAEHIVSDRKS